MLNNEIAFVNGKSSRDFGVFLIDGNIFDYPTREVEYLDVPGRSGSLTIDKGRWNNIDITYTFAAYDKDAPTKLNAWKEYLLANQGYQKIETSVEPDIYRQGVLKSASSPQISMVGGGGYVEVTFSCMPQKWLKEGADEATTLTNGLLIKNPTNFDAKPLLNIKASQVGAIIRVQNYLYDKIDGDEWLIADSNIKINTTEQMWIDCETCDAFDFNDHINYNSYVELTDPLIPTQVPNEFPVICGQSKWMQHPVFLRRQIYDAETRTRVYISNFSRADMYPRWWTI